jgi:hypothetical protein
MTIRIFHFYGLLPTSKLVKEKKKKLNSREISMLVIGKNRLNGIHKFTLESPRTTFEVFGK